VNIASGGTFDNSGYFYNGYGYGLIYSGGTATATATGTVNIASGGTFDNSGYFYNGYGYGLIYSGGTATATATGTVNIASGGTFDNSGYFYNGYGYGLIYSGGTATATATGTVNIASGGTFDNSGYFYNGYAAANNYYPGASVTATGTVNIASGGTFLNDTSGVIEQNAASSFSNAGTFTNLGTLEGGTFTNQSGGVFQHFAGNALGAISAVIFDNNGTFNIGYGNPSLATTTLTGSYTQLSTGTLAIRADWAAGTSDKLAVTGNATLAGTVVVTPLNFPSTAGLTKTFADIVTTTGTLDAAALTATNTAAVSYTLDKKTRAIDLIATINFQGIQTGGLTPN